MGNLCDLEVKSGSNAEPLWYAVHTRAKHEKKVEEELKQLGVRTYLPSIKRVSRWTDRNKVLDVPLFSCYLFVHTAITPSVYTTVSRASGVLGWVGSGKTPVPIPDPEINAVNALLASTTLWWPCPFLKVGQRVRIRGGSLDGVEGTLCAAESGSRLVISIEILQQSLSVSLDGYSIEPA